MLIWFVKFIVDVSNAVQHSSSVQYLSSFTVLLQNGIQKFAFWLIHSWEIALQSEIFDIFFKKTQKKALILKGLKIALLSHNYCDFKGEIFAENLYLQISLYIFFYLCILPLTNFNFYLVIYKKLVLEFTKSFNNFNFGLSKKEAITFK